MLSCRKENPSLNIKFNNKELPTVLSYVQGTWKLSYTGYLNEKFIPSHNIYMRLDSSKWMYSDTTGIYFNTKINWVKQYSGNSFIYSFSYKPPQLNFLAVYIVSEIKNDTLIIKEPILNGSSYYYVKE